MGNVFTINGGFSSTWIYTFIQGVYSELECSQRLAFDEHTGFYRDLFLNSKPTLPPRPEDILTI